MRRVIIDGRVRLVPADYAEARIPTLVDKGNKNIGTTSPFNFDKIDIGSDNVEKVTPFIGSKNFTVDDPDGSSQYPDGTPDGEGGRAYYTLQDDQQIRSGEIIILTSPMAIIPIYGQSFESPISSTPFGDKVEVGSTVTLYGISDEVPPKMVNSRTINYGVWLNGSVTFYKGQSIQLQLVLMDGLNIWLQISKNF